MNELANQWVEENVRPDKDTWLAHQAFEAGYAKAAPIWKPIETMDRKKYAFALFHDARTGITRILLWNPTRSNFEIPDPIGKICYFMEPTHWMELPDSPEPMEDNEND